MKRYERIWRNKFLTINAESLEDMVTLLEDAAKELRQMKEEGALLDEDGVLDDYAILYTYDEKLAEKWGFDDGWEEDDEEECN